VSFVSEAPIGSPHQIHQPTVIITNYKFINILNNLTKIYKHNLLIYKTVNLRLGVFQIAQLIDGYHP
jgi:hypothetical protein